MPSKPSLWEFVLALREQWFAAMSGGASVPFAALAVWVDNRYAQLIFAAMAFSCVWLSAFRVWRVERVRVNSLERTRGTQTLLDEIADLRAKLVRLRIELVRDPKGTAMSVEEGERRFKEIEKTIGKKIEMLAGKAEADIYLSRGNIQRAVGVSNVHQLYVDICIHDLDHLREFIKDYSRGKKA
jgi:hypothetical protein